MVALEIDFSGYTGPPTCAVDEDARGLVLILVGHRLADDDAAVLEDEGGVTEDEVDVA